jgi:TatD DNase family protein
MTRFVDTHCHLQDARFEDGVAEDAIGRAHVADIAMVLCGYDAPSNAAALAIAERHESVYPAVGFHPHEADDVTPAMLEELESLARLPEVVAVGEIGLDYYRNLSDHDAQRRVLEEQLAIATRVAKPVSVHTRGAEDVAWEPLAAYSRAREWKPGDAPMGVMHCFGGTLEQARRYITIGFVISIACTITYPKNDETRRVAAGLPLESLVVETDSPYLPPQFMRGGTNEPLHVRAAVEGVAAARNQPISRVAAATTANAQRVFTLAETKVSAW